MKPPRWAVLAVLLAAVLILTAWLILTPPGLTGKLWAVGYSVCHQAPARSFPLGLLQQPLCARCSGTFLAAAIGILYLLTRGRQGEIPRGGLAVVLLFFAAFWALDGLNSFLHILPGLPTLYESQNWLRLLTGIGLGIGLASIVVPIFNQSVWVNFIPQPSLGRWRDLAILYAICLAAAVLLASGVTWLAAPLAALSILGILLLLTLVYTIVWVFLTKNENRFFTLYEIWLPLLAGFLTALVQIGLIDWLRFLLTGTWDGFPLPG